MSRRRSQNDQNLEILVQLANSEEHVPEDLNELLAVLLVMPDNKVIGGPSLTCGTKQAMASSYMDTIGLVVGRLNRALGTDLVVHLGEESLLRHPVGDFPLESEVAWSAGAEEIPNTIAPLHARQGKGKIGTRWGKFIVEGNLPEFNELPSDKHVYWFLADSFINGRFRKMRQCRNCKRIWIARDRRGAFCSNKCGAAWDSRVNSGRIKRHQKQTRKTANDTIISKGFDNFAKMVEYAVSSARKQSGKVDEVYLYDFADGLRRIDDSLAVCEAVWQAAKEKTSIQEAWLRLPSSLQKAVGRLRCGS